MHSPDFNTHGFLRVAAATPVVSIADPLANAAAILTELQNLAEQNVAVAVFPELCQAAIRRKTCSLPKIYSAIAAKP